MNVDLSHQSTKSILFNKIEAELIKDGYQIVRKDFNRPWGGFFAMDEAQTAKFIEQFFPHLSVESVINGQKLSPKILVVAPQKRLSWQYHFRRSEVWIVEQGEVGVVRSTTDEQGEVEQLKKGDHVTLAKGERHRLVGLENWGIVAEIWQHTDPNQPSDEDDIVCLQDDFGR